MGLPASSDVASATTTVEAAPAPVVREDAGLVVRGKDNGKKDDKIVARAQVKTAGGTVTLYKKTSNGLKKLMTATMNAKGNHKFLGIKDRNGKKKTTYKVILDKTDLTKKGKGGRKVR